VAPRPAGRAGRPRMREVDPSEIPDTVPDDIFDDPF
jgi:hypothetical protein